MNGAEPEVLSVEPDLPDDPITAKQAGTIVQAEPGTVIAWAKQGKLRAWRIERRYVFSEREVRSLFVAVGLGQQAEPVRTCRQESRAAEDSLARLRLKGYRV